MSTTMALRADGNNKGIQNNDSVMTVVSAPWGTIDETKRARGDTGPCALYQRVVT